MTTNGHIDGLSAYRHLTKDKLEKIEDFWNRYDDNKKSIKKSTWTKKRPYEYTNIS